MFALKNVAIILALLLLYVSCVEQLPLLTMINKTLVPPAKAQFNLTLSKDTIDPNSDLYIVSHGKTQDPYDVPDITITRGNKTWYCIRRIRSEACVIHNVDLHPQDEFKIQASCIDTCNFTLQAYFSQYFRLDLGRLVDVVLSKQYPVFVAVVQVPKTLLNYTEIAIVASLVQVSDIDQGIQMIANVRDEIVVPSGTYDFSGQDVWDDGKGLFLTQVKPGQYVTIEITGQVGTIIRLSAHTNFGGDIPLALGQEMFDDVQYNDAKWYLLDLDWPSNDSLVINMIKYSGAPSVRVCSDRSLDDSKTVVGIIQQSLNRFYITPKLRKQMGFNTTVYIYVNSYIDSTYSLTAYLDDSDYITMNEDEVEMSELDGSEVDNYIYTVTQSQNSTVKELHIKISVEVMLGDLEFVVRRCKSVQEGGPVSSCIYTDQEKIIKDQKLFSEIVGDWKVYGNIGQLTFKYPVAKCPVASNNTIACIFHIACFKMLKSMPLTRYQIETRRINNGIDALYETKPRRQRVHAGEYSFFVYKPKNMNEIQEVRFILTTISGDCVMIGSTDTKAVTFENSYTFDVATNDVLIYEDAKISKKFYISVKAFQTSYFSLTVEVRRKNEQNFTNTSLLLKEGVPQNYAPKDTEKKVYFQIKLDESKPFRVRVDSRSVLPFTVYTYSNGATLFNKSKWTSERSQCYVYESPELAYSSSKQFTVEINFQGNYSDRSFSIQFSETKECINSILSQASFIYLDSGSTDDKTPRQCIQVVLNRAASLQVVITASALSLTLDKVLVSMAINNSKSNISDYFRTISADEIKAACPLLSNQTTNATKISQCRLMLEFTPYFNQSTSFAVVAQYLDDQIQLFDGMGQSISTTQISKNSAKHFFYQLNNLKEILTTLKSSTKANFSIYGRLVESKQYLNGTQSQIYPRKIDSKTYDFYSQTTSIGLTSMLVTNKLIKNKNSRNSVLLLSVYSDQDANTTTVFTITVTQSTVRTYFGDSNAGYTVDGMLTSYEVYVSEAQPILISLNSYGKKCTSMNISYKKDGEQQIMVGSTEASYAIVSAQDSNPGQYLLTVQVLGTASCFYQFSFVALTNNVHELLENVPRDLVLKNNDKSYYMYLIGQKPNNSKTWKDEIIVPMIEYGFVQIRAGIVEGSKIKELQKQISSKTVSNDTFQYNTATSTALTILGNDTQLCETCYIVYEVTGLSDCALTLLLTKNQEKIPIIQNKVIQERMVEGVSRTYVHHSLTGFNLSLDVMYGEISVKVVKSRNQTVAQKSGVKIKELLLIPHPPEEQNSTFELYQVQSEYTIQITAQKESAYALQILTDKAKFRVKEGLPFQFALKGKDEPMCMEFIGAKSQSPSHLILETTSSKLISYTLGCIMQHTSDKCPDILILNQSVSQENINLEIVSANGIFVFCISSQKDANVSLLLSRLNITKYVKSNSENLMRIDSKANQYYTLYNPNNSNVMIEVFECSSNPLKIQISSKYQDLIANTSELIIEHGKKAGHYISSTQTKQGIYYAQASSPKGSGLFVLKYSFFTGEELPYSQLYTEGDDYAIRSVFADGSLFFQVKKIQSSHPNLNVISHYYQLYLSTSSEVVRSVSQCELGQTYNKTISFGPLLSSTPEIIQFEVPEDDIIDMLETYAYIYVAVVCNIQADPNKALGSDYYKIIYDSIQLSTDAAWVEMEMSRDLDIRALLLLVILPAILGAALLLLTTCFCVRKFREMRHVDNTLIQEQEVQQVGSGLQNAAQKQEQQV